MRQLVLDIQPDEPATFDNYIIGDNADVLAALKASVIGAGHVTLWGAPASGRSHLLQATVAAAMEAGRPAMVLAADQIERNFSPATDTLLAIDDVENLEGGAQIAIFNAFNRARAQNLTLILSASRPPLALDVREDLRTRIGQTLVFELKPLDDETRRDILATLAARRGLQLNEDVLQFLLRHGRRDLRALLLVLDELDRASLERKRSVTLPLLRDLIQTGLDI